MSVCRLNKLNELNNRTKPCLTPNFIAKISDKILFHLTVEKYFSQFSRRSNNARF